MLNVRGRRRAIVVRAVAVLNLRAIIAEAWLEVFRALEQIAGQQVKCRGVDSGCLSGVSNDYRQPIVDSRL